MKGLFCFIPNLKIKEQGDTGGDVHFALALFLTLKYELVSEDKHRERSAHACPFSSVLCITTPLLWTQSPFFIFHATIMRNFMSTNYIYQNYVDEKTICCHSAFDSLQFHIRAKQYFSAVPNANILL
jgi:hypothetical protein